MFVGGRLRGVTTWVAACVVRASGTLLGATQHREAIRDCDCIACMQHAIMRAIGDHTSHLPRLTWHNVSKCDD